MRNAAIKSYEKSRLNIFNIQRLPTIKLYAIKVIRIILLICFMKTEAIVCLFYRGIDELFIIFNIFRFEIFNGQNIFELIFFKKYNGYFFKF